MESEEKLIVKHVTCELYIVERLGTWARWGDRSEAMKLTKDEWDKELSSAIRSVVVFEPLTGGSDGR